MFHKQPNNEIKLFIRNLSITQKDKIEKDEVKQGISKQDNLSSILKHYVDLYNKSTFPIQIDIEEIRLIKQFIAEGFLNPKSIKLLEKNKPISDQLYITGYPITEKGFDYLRGLNQGPNINLSILLIEGNHFNTEINYNQISNEYGIAQKDLFELKEFIYSLAEEQNKTIKELFKKIDGSSSEK